MTIAPIVADAWKQMRPPRKKHVRQEHKRCIICTIVVDEAVIVKGEEQWEGFVKTDDGLICNVCADDSEIEPQQQRSVTRANRLVTFNAQMRRREKLPKSGDGERVERNAEIMRMAEAGATYAQIAETVNLSRAGVGNVVRQIRRRMAFHGQT